MYLYANILKWLTVVCMAFGIIINIVGFVFPEKIYSGELLNNVAFTFMKISVPITLILYAVGYLIWKPDRDVMLNFSTLQTIIFWVIIAYIITINILAYCGAIKGPSLGPESALTPATLLITFGIFNIFWDFILLVITTNILRAK